MGTFVYSWMLNCCFSRVGQKKDVLNYHDANITSQSSYNKQYCHIFVHVAVSTCGSISKRKSPELLDQRVQEAFTLKDVIRLLFAAVYTPPIVHDAYFLTSSLLDFTSL